MLEGKTPFLGKTSFETFKNIQNLKGLEFKTTTDEHAKHLIVNLLRLEPESRIGSESMKHVKDHEFFKEINWENLRYINPPFAPIEKKQRS